MKELFLVRHAKSDWGNMDLKDIDRPLKDRGIRDALFMGEFMSKNFEMPEMVLTSPACRAFHTSVLLVRAMKTSYRIIRVDENIYLVSFNELSTMIKNTDDRISRLMLVGHNPGITDLANYFMEEFIHNIPTSGIAYFRFDTEKWQQIAVSNLIKHELHYPKELLKNI